MSNALDYFPLEKSIGELNEVKAPCRQVIREQKLFANYYRRSIEAPLRLIIPKMVKNHLLLD